MTFGKAITVPKKRRDPLDGDGPIVNRARVALTHTAAQFGEVIASDKTSVTVRGEDGSTLTLQYDGGNYIFTRVYNLRITIRLPDASAVPSELTLSHRDRRGPRFVSRTGRPGISSKVEALNEYLGTQLRSIDLVSASISGSAGARTLSLVPMGGSFVWVLIPPVFKATAFPPGEVARISELLRSMRSWTPVAH